MKAWLAGAALVCVAGCGSEHAAIPALVSAHAAAQSPSASLATKLAPAAMEEAKRELDLADRARDQGNDVDAALHAERAMAQLQRATMMARAARASTELSEASRDLAVAQASLGEVVALRKEAEREGESLERRLFVLKETRAARHMEASDPRREAARLVVARSLNAEARLMCSAAKLLDETAQGVDAAMSQVDAADAKIEGGKARGDNPLDAAANARQECLRVLGRARRAPTTAARQAADPLLTELSASGDQPTRIERGVAITLRDVFSGASIAAAAKPRLEALGRIAAAHPGAAVQVVVHDAKPSTDATARAETVRAALVAAGAPATTTAGSAGTRMPIVDPSDAAHASRNARVEIVFITAD